MPHGITRPRPDALSREVSTVVDRIRRTATDIRPAMSGRQLSDATGIGTSSGARLYRGDLSWTLPELEAVCAVLNVSVSSVVAEAEAAVAQRSRLASLDGHRTKRRAKADVRPARQDLADVALDETTEPPTEDLDR